MIYGGMRDNIYCHFTAAVIAGKYMTLILTFIFSLNFCFTIRYQFWFDWNFMLNRNNLLLLLLQGFQLL